jgi:uncharacterized membrane protein YgdD (TMEM256/DUF423 family)
MCPYHKFFFSAGALLGLLSVVAGAFGSHSLKDRWMPDQMHVFEIAVRYQMYHALALLATAWACTYFNASFATAAGWFFILGTLIFSGSLYLLLFFKERWLGALTPWGGLLLLFGWFFLIVSAWTNPPS